MRRDDPLLLATPDEEAAAEPCFFCGEPARAEVLEVWGREFMLDTCCEGQHESITEFLNEDPRGAGRWLGQTGLNDLLAGARGYSQGLRRVVEHDGQLLLDWNLEVVPVEWAVAREFVRVHHRHCKRPRGWRFGAGLMNGGDLIAVIVVGRPVARMLDHTRIVEVSRLCVRQDLPSELAWNACSRLYGWAAREAKSRRFERIITYTLAKEPGTTLRAAGWTPDSFTPGRGWDSPARAREDNTPTDDKLRWTRTLVDKPVSLLRPNLPSKRHLERLAGTAAGDALSLLV